MLPSGLLPIGGYQNSNNISTEIDDYPNLISNFFVAGDLPVISNKIVLHKELVCLQMIIEKPIELEIKNEIIKLRGQHDDDLFELIDLVQPGYFKKKTAQLGDYLLINCIFYAFIIERITNLIRAIKIS